MFGFFGICQSDGEVNIRGESRLWTETAKPPTNAYGTSISLRYVARALSD
jgi:hypothetical protein